MRIPDTELFIGPDGRCYHLGLRPCDVADTVILVGDQDRVDVFREFFDSIEQEHRCREFHSLTGCYRGKRFTVLSTGIGTDNIDIAVTELDALANVDFDTHEVRPSHRSLTLLRLGTCGAVQPDIPLGSFIFTSKAIGLDNVLNYYAGRDSVCDLALERAFVSQVHWDPHLHAPYVVDASPELVSLFCSVSGSDAGSASGSAAGSASGSAAPCLRGLTLSSSGFYGPQGRCVRAPLAMPSMLDDFEAFRYRDEDGREWRVTNFEMESSALYGLGRILGHKVGTICVAMGNRHLKTNAPDHATLIRQMIALALGKL